MPPLWNPVSVWQCQPIKNAFESPGELVRALKRRGECGTERFQFQISRLPEQAIILHILLIPNELYSLEQDSFSADERTLQTSSGVFAYGNLAEDVCKMRNTWGVHSRRRFRAPPAARHQSRDTDSLNSGLVMLLDVQIVGDAASRHGIK